MVHFLDQDLAMSRATWKFVAFHHTIYSSGPHGSSRRRRKDLVPLLDQHGVDVVFMGHDHTYERTRPLRGNRIVKPGAGTTYVTTGGGGARIYPVRGSRFSAHAESSFHFVRVRVEEHRLWLEMIRHDGSVGDVVELERGLAPAPRQRGGRRRAMIDLKAGVLERASSRRGTSAFASG